MKTLLIALIASVSINVSASEIRYIKELPSSGKTTVNDLKKAKSPGWLCQKAKTDKNSGNTNKDKKSKKNSWYPLASIPEPTDAQSNEIDTLLEQGKSVFKCTLKEYDKESKKMANAEIDGEDEE